MPSKIAKSISLFVAMLLIALIPLAIGVDQTKIHAPTIILAHLTVGLLLFSLRRRLSTFLSPNSLVFFYVSLSLFLGSIAFKMDAVLVANNLLDYSTHQFSDIALFFVLFGLSFLPLVEILHKEKRPSCAPTVFFNGTHLFTVLLVSLPALSVGLDLSAIGGSGGLNTYILSLLSVSCVVYLQRFSFLVRYLGYFFIILSLVVLFSHDKRIAIFLIFPIALLEAHRGTLTVSMRGALISVVGVTTVLYLILVMSINRSYGGFVQDEGVLEASKYVLAYVKVEYFLAALFQNIEVSYFYFHYMNAAEFILSGREKISLGSTLVKPLFLPFPRDLIPWKPDSMIDLYTTAHDPGFRLRGGSWPPNFAAEYLWNFHLLGIVIFPIFGFISARFYRAINAVLARPRPYMLVFMMFVYMNIITYARGSGLDLFIFICLVPGFFLFCAYLAYFVLISAAGTKTEGHGV